MDFVSDKNKWNDNDSDDEYDDEYVQNEISPEDIEEEFVNNILNVKHSLYDNIILAPELETNKAQDNTILQEYLNKLNDIYVMSIRVQNGSRISEKELNVFPKESRDAIRQSLDWIRDYFSKNKMLDTIPYSDFIRKSYRDYQFVQTDSFN